ncbi:hypothetical protein [Methylomusa anaerophila]|uniref:hypothetical protein n=1 Tax=Methylomusa anaerophila TaxID=1930071 RepID=UPI0011AE3AB4|nr:hypothetical protein [Methylomusa anaerophila]
MYGWYGLVQSIKQQDGLRRPVEKSKVYGLFFGSRQRFLLWKSFGACWNSFCGGSLIGLVLVFIA